VQAVSRDEANLPAQRLRVALDLFELGEAMLRQRWRRVRPMASETEIEAAVAAWRTERAGAEHGDAPGKPRPWPLG
jgi:hypothetical protein